MQRLKRCLSKVLPKFFLDRLGFFLYRKELLIQGKWPLWRAERALRAETKGKVLQTYSDKIFYKMGFDRNPILRVWADKVAVREYVSATIGQKYLSRVFGIFLSPNEIVREKLPPNFVVKPNHASGAVIIVWEGAQRKDSKYLESFMNSRWGRVIINPKDLNWQIINEILNKWLSQDYFYEPGFFPEWAYKGIPRSLIVEEYLSEGEDGVAQDDRLFIFNGVCEYIELDKSWNEKPTRTMFDANWNLVDAKLKYPPAIPTPNKPDEIGVMIGLAEKLAQGVDHVRCDFYLLNSRIIFGELTNYHTGGNQEIIVNGNPRIFGQSWHPENLY